MGFDERGDYSRRMETDLAYFRRRASEEQLAAADAETSEAFQAHDALAARYEELALAIETQMGSWGMAADEPSQVADPQQEERAVMWL